MSVDGIPSSIGLDPKIANSQAHYIIEKGATRVSYYPIEATSFGDSSMIFSVVPSSKNVYVSKKMSIRFTATITFTKNVAHSQPLLEEATVAPFGRIMVGQNDSLAFMPIQSKCCDNFSLQLNQQSVTGNMKDWLEPLMRYGYGDSDIEGYLSTGPAKHDAYNEFSRANLLGSERNPMADYGNSETLNRGGTLYKIISNTTTESVIKVSWSERLMLSPLTCSNAEEQGFIGLNNLNLNLSLSRLNERLWSHDVDGAGFDFDSINVVLERPTLCLLYLTPPLMARSSLNNTYPYYQIERYITDPQKILAAGASDRYNSNNIQLNSVPKRAYIYFKERDRDLSYRKPDSYAAIKNLSVNFNNSGGILSAALSEDLYDLSCRNGLKMSWPAFRYWLGSPICIDFGRDVGISELTAVGMTGQYSLSINADIENISSTDKNYIMYVVVVSEGSIRIIGTQVEKKVGNVVPDNLFDDLNNLDAIAYSPQKDFYGGNYTGAGFWDSIKKFARKAFKGVQTALPYVKKALPYAEQAVENIAPYIAPLMAAGYSNDDIYSVIRKRNPNMSTNKIKKMLDAGGIPSTGGGVRVKSNRHCGGRKASRKSLRNRM